MFALILFDYYHGFSTIIVLHPVFFIVWYHWLSIAYISIHGQWWYWKVTFNNVKVSFHCSLIKKIRLMVKKSTFTTTSVIIYYNNIDYYYNKLIFSLCLPKRAKITVASLLRFPSWRENNITIKKPKQTFWNLYFFLNLFSNG